MAGLADFGKREDGTAKGTGWFGILPIIGPIDQPGLVDMNRLAWNYLDL